MHCIYQNHHLMRNVCILTNSLNHFHNAMKRWINPLDSTWIELNFTNTYTYTHAHMNWAGRICTRFNGNLIFGIFRFDTSYVFDSVSLWIRIINHIHPGSKSLELWTIHEHAKTPKTTTTLYMWSELLHVHTTEFAERNSKHWMGLHLLWFYQLFIFNGFFQSRKYLS